MNAEIGDTVRVRINDAKLFVEITLERTAKGVQDSIETEDMEVLAKDLCPCGCGFERLLLKTRAYMNKLELQASLYNDLANSFATLALCQAEGSTAEYAQTEQFIEYEKRILGKVATLPDDCEFIFTSKKMETVTAKKKGEGRNVGNEITK